MPNKHVLLDTASFLDSGHVPVGVERADAKQIVERFLVACYEELGKPPKDLDGHDAHGVVGHLLPGHFQRKDPLAEHVPDVLRAYVDHLEETQLVAQSFELRHGLEGTFDEFLETVRTGSNPHHGGPKQETVKHQAEKLGRNEPCFCGSGKKFKKCCGKGA